MSIIRAIKHRLGLSVTPANNFVLDASADNGTMKLARETGQDIMTVDAAGKVVFPQLGQSLTPKGYSKLPGGLILQWDESPMVTVPALTVTPFTFNLTTPFPNGFLSAQMSFSYVDVIGPYPVYGIEGSTTQVSGAVYANTAIHCKVRMLAIGY